MNIFDLTILNWNLKNKNNSDTEDILNKADKTSDLSICFETANMKVIPNIASIVLIRRDSNNLVFKSIVDGKYQARTTRDTTEINNIHALPYRES
jgi:hypothetical protein